MPTTNQEARLGDSVRLQLANREVRGVIVEDRGKIGFAGRQLFRVHVPMEPLEPLSLLLPADELEVIDASSIPAHLERDAIINYLKNGGLLLILLHPGSRVWLCFDTLENVTHTFIPERGLIGGETVPWMTLFENNKIFEPKTEAVAKFIESFGLTPSQTNQVIAEVGIAS